MKRSLWILTAALALVFTAGGCATRAENGAAIGAGVGAVIGYAIGKQYDDDDRYYHRRHRHVVRDDPYYCDY